MATVIVDTHARTIEWAVPEGSDPNVTTVHPPALIDMIEILSDPSYDNRIGGRLVQQDNAETGRAWMPECTYFRREPT